ncbi:MAG: GH3 auxin-responsive promoter family protein, partial [Saprospiraceae bacterium]|nr:GH3 auxin-responsive promoter family protein [Saprospiraceae bacterium]
MGLLGNIIKGALNITSEFDLDLKNDEKKQLAMLSQLLTKAQNTAFGKFYDFQSVLHQGDLGGTYRKHVPIFEYNEMYDRWWQQQLIRPDITWPGQPKFYARTSGTTGSESKRIPITEEFISSMRKVGFDLIKGLAAYDLEDEIFESEVLTISSTASLDRHKEGHLEGEISGINIYNLPDWYDLFHRPGKDIARIPEWDDRLEQIVKAAPQWDIGFIAGIPSWVLQVLKAVVKRYDLDDIRDLWPRLRVYMSGGVAFGTYEESFRKLCGDSLLVIDTYLASEGFFAFSNIP